MYAIRSYYAFSYLARGTEEFEEWGRIPKTECARRILARLERGPA